VGCRLDSHRCFSLRSLRPHARPGIALVEDGFAAPIGAVSIAAFAKLVALTAPKNPTARVAPTEDMTYQVSASLTEFKTEADSDYHLVLSSGAKTMIAEIPSPACVTGGPFLAGIANARAEFDARLMSSTQRFQKVNMPATVTGVGFFDRIHGQTGVAPNGVDIQFP
jgi:hypothetical protein